MVLSRGRIRLSSGHDFVIIIPFYLRVAISENYKFRTTKRRPAIGGTRARVLGFAGVVALREYRGAVEPIFLSISCR